MYKKIVVILVMTLLIAITVLPVLGVKIDIDQKYTKPVDSYNLEIEIDTNNLNNIVTILDIYEIYEGQYFKLTLIGHWTPPDPTKTICLWADAATMPTGATLTPPCNCALGEVTSIFEWTPTVGQAGTYQITFYLGEACGSPMGSLIVTIIVHPSGQDDPPLVVIQSPEDGKTVNNPDITVIGYATDDIGIWSIGSHHEWTSDEAITSGTIPQTTYYPFTWDFELHEGWNRITIFVSDTKNQNGQDQVVIYYVIQTNQPPNKPTTPSGQTSGTTGTSYRYESYFSDPDGDSIEILFDWGDGTDTGWIGPVVSGTSVGEYHTYTSDGNYQIRTRARDIPNNEESEWSNSLSISMPKTKVINIPLTIQKLFHRFPIFEKILNQII